VRPIGSEYESVETSNLVETSAAQE